MILIGQYDSPFARRVAIALKLYGLDYEHWPWSTFADAERLAAYNPLRRVPVLILDEGEVLVESGAILDAVDERMGPRRALMDSNGARRRRALQVCALATGLCDKLVSLIYERALHEQISTSWVSRCEAQIQDVLGALEANRRQTASPFWFGDGPGHADVAVACAMRFLREAHPGLHRLDDRPALSLHAARCEALPAFAAVVQRFAPPSR
jgi:glutathione S-transferase